MSTQTHPVSFRPISHPSLGEHEPIAISAAKTPQPKAAPAAPALPGGGEHARAQNVTSKVAASLARAADKLTPSAACKSAVVLAPAQLSTDFRALMPKLETFGKHLKAAGPALLRVGTDVKDVVASVAKIVRGVENLERIAVEAVVSVEIPPVAAVVVLDVAVSLTSFMQGVAEYWNASSRLPNDVAVADPHVRQLLQDIRSMHPDLMKLKADAEKAIGLVRHECLRM